MGGIIIGRTARFVKGSRGRKELCCRGIFWCREGESNPQGTKYRRILSPLRLPVPPSRLGSLLRGRGFLIVRHALQFEYLRWHWVRHWGGDARQFHAKGSALAGTTLHRN